MTNTSTTTTQNATPNARAATSASACGRDGQGSRQGNGPCPGGLRTNGQHGTHAPAPRPGGTGRAAGPFARAAGRGGFTLVEILIVVIILGILAAIVIPQFTNASTDARKNSVVSQLQTVRSAIQLFKLQHNDTLPALAGAGQFNQLLNKSDITGTVSASGALGPYLESVPKNPLNGNIAVVDSASSPTATTAWIYNATTGDFTATNQTATLVYDETAGTVN